MMRTIWSQTLDILRNEGWRQGPFDFGRSRNGRCLWEAHSISVQEMRASEALASVQKITEHLGLLSASETIDWNDAPERTFTQVEKLLTELHEKELAERGVLYEHR